jgi:hypothetical protein
MIYDPERHMPLCSEIWDPVRVLDTVSRIFEDVCKAMEPCGLWPAHPDEDSTLGYNKSIYNGAAGTVWGLGEMSRRLNRDLPFDSRGAAHHIYQRYLLEPDTEAVVPSLLLGESGLLLLLQKVNPSLETATRLKACIAANAKNPVNEALWGAPGTMLAALRSGETELFRSSAACLFEEWVLDDGIWIWHQDLYGKMRKFIGAGHGFFGNVHALLAGQPYLSSSQVVMLHERIVQTALCSAKRENGRANWPPSFHTRDPQPMFTQWCHGAPGVVTSLRSFPKNVSVEMETLLLEAGETIWASGPLKKGIGICHGTDGNGYALLQLFARTQDEKWLIRARRFAMHALTQRNGRCTLWTGEIGLALFLLACVDEVADFPILDYF